MAVASGATALAGLSARDVGFARLLRPFRFATDLSSAFEASSARSASVTVRNNAPSSFPSPSPPSKFSTKQGQSAVHAASTSTMVLDERFPIVADSLATHRAAAAEALALAKAAAIAAEQAAALAAADDLSILGSLTSRTPEHSWDVAGFLQSGGIVSDDGLGVVASVWESAYSGSSATDLVHGYISDKQQLAAAFAAPSAPVKARRLHEAESGTGQPGQPAVARAMQKRVLIASGKKGRRGPRERRSVKALAAQGEEGSLVDKMVITGVPGSLRDLMDSTPGASGLLTGVEEVQLSKDVQALLKLEGKLDALKEKLGRDPSREEWALAAGMPRAQLEKSLHKGRTSKQRMMSCNMGLVIATARKYSTWGLSLEETLTRGCAGLIKAIEKFDHRKGFKFSTYAHWWIRQAIGRSVTEQARTVRMPPHIYELLGRITKARDMLVRELGRNPLDDEVAELVGMSVVRMKKILKIARPMVSMDKPTSLDSEQTMGSFVASPDDETHEIGIERKLLLKDLENAMHTLLPRERDVLRLRYGLSDGRARTLEEVGAAFSVTRERIRQLEQRALRKLRQPSRCTVLQEYVE